MNAKRVKILKDGSSRRGPVVYWMSRDQRMQDNWALLYAQKAALEAKVPLAVVFCLVDDFLGATLRQYDFMCTGLAELEENLRKKGIPFHLRRGDPGGEIPRFAETRGAGLLVTDFDPLRIKRQWKEEAVRRVSVPFHEVDAHNIVPCRHASDKQEFAARTFRPKISAKLEHFFERFPDLVKHPFPWKGRSPKIDWAALRDSLPLDRSVSVVTQLKPGEDAAQKALESFIDNKLATYEEKRNNPLRDGQSGLSPYLHFGQLSAQRVAMEVWKCENSPSKKAFLEELIVRRELSDNFCFHNPHYDTTAAFPDWARKTLEEHRHDRRDHVYNLRELESAVPHDPLWNAAQMEMAKQGIMHGYMRMYWAKKIFEWSETPGDALRKALYLNDRYELDGRDPNGYTGCAWAIGGVHDRAWFQRPLFGKIRYMSYNGCRQKFNVDAYIDRIERL